MDVSKPGSLSSRCTFELSIPGASEEWGARVERVCRVLENAVSSDAAILWSRSQKDGVADQRIVDRESVLRKVQKSSARWFSLHNGRDCYINRSGALIDHGQVSVGGRFNDLARKVYSLTVSFPCKQCHDLVSLFCRVSDEAKAIWGCYSPEPTRIQLRAGHFIQNWEYALEHGAVESVTKLPRLGHLEHGARMESPLQPEVFGWLNYWSIDTAAWLGLSDSRDDLSLFKVAQTSTGAWFVQIAQDPLDLRRPTHVEALLEAYSRFPKLGMRLN